MTAFFDRKGQPHGEPVPLSPQEADDCLRRGAVIVDIRPGFETNYRVFAVPRVCFLPYAAYRQDFAEVPRDEPLVVADNVGTKSPEVARFLLGQGYEQVAFLVGGVVAWAQDGFPLTRDADYELVGGCGCKLKPKKPRKEGSTVAPKPDGKE